MKKLDREQFDFIKKVLLDFHYEALCVCDYKDFQKISNALDNAMNEVRNEVDRSEWLK